MLTDVRDEKMQRVDLVRMRRRRARIDVIPGGGLWGSVGRLSHDREERCYIHAVRAPVGLYQS